MAKHLVVVTRSWPVTQKLPLALHKLAEGTVSTDPLVATPFFFFFFFGPKIYGTKRAGPRHKPGLWPTQKRARSCARNPIVQDFLERTQNTGFFLKCPKISLYTHDCTATHSSNVIVKFADDTTVIGLITDNDETAYREEVSTLTKWCQENHLSLNIDKTKELVVDYRRQSREHTPITIDKTPVERVTSFKFLGVHITEDLTWSAHTDAVLKKAHQRLFFLRRLRKFGTSPRILRSFYTCTVESILTGCITAWYGNSTAGNRRALQRVVRTARHIVGGELPSLQDIYTRRCTRKARRIIKDSSHPSHRLLSLLPSGRRFRSIRSRTSRLRDSFFPQAIRLMNSHK